MEKLTPTLNEKYNKLYATLSKPGLIAAIPGCEDCGKDLTGKNIIDTGLIWCCESCAKKIGNWHKDNYKDFDLLTK